MKDYIYNILDKHLAIEFLSPFLDDTAIFLKILFKQKIIISANNIFKKNRKPKKYL